MATTTENNTCATLSEIVSLFEKKIEDPIEKFEDLDSSDSESDFSVEIVVKSHKYSDTDVMDILGDTIKQKLASGQIPVTITEEIKKKDQVVVGLNNNPEDFRMGQLFKEELHNSRYVKLEIPRGMKIV